MKKTKDTWNLSPLYKSDTDPKIKRDMKLAQEANYRFINKWKNRDDYLKNPKILRQALDELDKIWTTVGITGDFGYYFSLRSTQEENNPKLKGILNKISETATIIDNDSQFFELKLAKVPPIIQKKFLKARELQPYHYWLKKLFANAHYLLSEVEEKILNLKSRPAHGQWVDMTSTLLAKQSRIILDENGKKADKPMAEIINLSASSKKKVRDQAFSAMLEINNRYAEVAEAEINAILSNKKINDELRGFPRPDSSRHLADDIDTKVVDAMIDSVQKNFNVARQYHQFKAKLLGKKQLDYHERRVPYGQINKVYSWSESVALVNQVLSKLDPDFSKIFQQFVANRQIDVYPYKGKSGGAMCTHNLKSQPTYILLNHGNRLQDVLTLAHEVGHGINNELMRQKQNSFYFGTPLSTAEVASTFIEDFVLEELKEEADDNLKLALMVNKLEDDISVIWRQVAAYRFEQELHLKFKQLGYLAKEDIGKIFKKNMNDYLGPAIKQPPGTENFWVYWSHFRNFFYVYSYASGLLISKSLQASVRQNPDFIYKIKDFLSAGLSQSPQEIFQKLDIDISQPTFWNKGIKETKTLLKESTSLAKKLGKI